MRVWIIAIGEPIPRPDTSPRLLRAGLLSQELANQGHEVTWWTSTFDHFTKRHLFDQDTVLHPEDGLEIVALRATGYSRHVGLRRLLNDVRLGHGFQRASGEREPPDVILCCFPPIALPRTCARYAKEHNVPFVLDIRDLWPDALGDRLSRPLSLLLRPAISLVEEYVSEVAEDARAIIGTTEEYVEWGCGKAGREVDRLDRSFPLVTPSQPPSSEAREEAETFWDGLGVPATGKMVGCFFGSMNAQFDFAHIIETAEALDPDRYLFVLCGDGERLAELRRRASGLPNVILPGWLEWPQIWTLMARSNFGIAPYKESHWFRNNLTNKPIEYLSGGLPVLTPLGGLLAQLIEEEDCGIYYKTPTKVALTEAIQRLGTSPNENAAMARRARALYERRFRTKEVLGEMIEHLRLIADGT